MMRAGNNLALAVISATRAMLASAASGATHVRPTRRAGVRVRWMVFFANAGDFSWACLRNPAL
jgi:hypothetical protein